MKEALLEVEGMTCNHCVRHVTEALTALEGVQAVEVRLEAGKAKVTFDPTRVAIPAMVAALDEAGYDARGA